MKKYEIWVEGYMATGESGQAFLLNDGKDNKPNLIEAEDFNHAVEIYMTIVPEHDIVKNQRNRYWSDEDYKNRKSNWNIWACNLFDNELDARKSFG